MSIDLIRSHGKHRWTWRDRIADYVRWASSQLVIMVAFWLVVVGLAGIVAGFVWAAAMAQ